MTDNEIEETIKNSRAIIFQQGIHSLFSDEVPGMIGLLFNNETLLNAIEMYEYIQKDLLTFTKRIHIKQSDLNKIDFTFIIEKDPAIVITVKNLDAKEGQIKMFLEKEPQNKPINLSIIHNGKPDTIENMAFLASASLEANLHQPIHIHFWSGLSLGTS